MRFHPCPYLKVNYDNLNIFNEICYILLLLLIKLQFKTFTIIVS